MGQGPAQQSARRNRMIAIAAGAITFTAIVLAFASAYLGLQWLWLRPAAELLLLAELVGLIILERHQLFEPVSSKVDEMGADVKAVQTGLVRIGDEFRQLTQRLDESGQISFLPDPSEATRAMTRALREALAREQTSPQILRWVRLAAYLGPSVNLELTSELRELVTGFVAFQRYPDTPSDARSRAWTARNILTFTNSKSLNLWREKNLPLFMEEGSPLNTEGKLFVRARAHAEAILTPNLVTDRDVIVTLEDDNANHRWGFRFQGRQYVEIFARWFDELWASIPDSNLFISRNGLNEKALDRIRQELEAAEAARNQAPD